MAATAAAARSNELESRTKLGWTVYRLHELPNDIVGTIPAAFEPSLDYVVVKIPRWNFEKFRGVEDALGSAMQSIGEVMALGRTFWPMFLLITQLGLLVSAALIGNHLNGVQGFIVGIAVVEWLNYPITAFVMIRHRLWQPEIDLPALAISALAVAVAYLVI